MCAWQSFAAGRAGHLASTSGSVPRQRAGTSAGHPLGSLSTRFAGWYDRSKEVSVVRFESLQMVLCVVLGAWVSVGSGCGSRGGRSSAGRSSAGSSSAGRTAMSATQKGNPFFRSELRSGAQVKLTRHYHWSKRSRQRFVSYWIDRTAVTRRAYAAWLATSPPLGKQLQRCKGNKSFAPEKTCAPRFPRCKGADCPVTCVDWCDAWAYCRAVGKTLCGRIGGGANAWRKHTDARLSQWHNACVAQNVKDAPRLVVGKVWEWVDTCESGSPWARCRTRTVNRGIPGRHDPAAGRHVTCFSSNAYARLTRWAHVGFRCCRQAVTRD